MADTGHDDATPKPYGASPELVRTMIGSAPLFEAERGDRSTTILPAFDASHDARKLVREAQRELDATQDHPREAARLNHDVALVFDERLDDFHRGLLSYQRAQELDPTNRAYMSAARVCYRQRENWTMTLALLDAELDVVSDPVERGRLLFDKGLIFEEWLSHGAMAQKLYEEALAAVPGDLEVLHQLRRLLMQRGDPQGRLEVCRRAIAATTDRRQRSLLYAEVARIQLEVLNDEEQALESYAVAFVEDPANSAVSDAVLRLNSRRGRLGEVVDVLLTTGDLAESDQGRRTRYLTAARICRDRLGQSDRALELLERVQYEDLDRQTGREMAELLGAAGRMEELLQLYTKHLDPTVGASAALLHYRVAELLARHLRRKDEARVHYLRALAADPSFLAARHALECSYHEAKDASGLLELRRGELRSIGDPVEQAFQLTRLALLCAEHLGDLEEATDLLKRALITVDGFAPARRELVLIYERGGAHKPLAALLEQEIEIQGLELAPLPLLRLAELAEREFLDLERAAKLYRRALDQAPRQISILRSLERLYALLGKHEERLELLEREGELARDPHLKRHLASRAAQLCDEVLGRSDEAEKRYRAILEEYPLDRGVLASVVRLCEARGGTGELVAIYRGQLDHGEAVAPSWRAMLHCRSGQILEEFLGQPEAAIDEFEHVLVDDPKNGYALAEIARLQRAAGRWDELYETLRRQAAHAEDPDDRASVLLSAGDLALHRRDDANLALTCYREALEAQPDHAAARDAALGILFAEGRYAEATVILEDALGQTSNGRQRLILLKRLGALWSEELGDERRAVAILHEGLGIDANDVELLAGLDRLYRRLHDDEGIVANAERLASASEDRHECLRYLYEAVRVVEARLVDTRDPAVLYQEILAHAPTDKRALFALARLHTQRDEPDALKKVYEALVQEETNEDRRRQILLRLASVRERLDDLSGAVSALVEVKGSNDWFVQRELRRLYELLGQWED
ncbi:MAG: hypothetical protein KAI47_10900, partial [Deltaproteobacteria bacterium]|nr:hypothetical protein [Deltaproteobacteria bacterium]